MLDRVTEALKATNWHTRHEDGVTTLFFGHSTDLQKRQPVATWCKADGDYIKWLHHNVCHANAAVVIEAMREIVSCN